LGPINFDVFNAYMENKKIPILKAALCPDRLLLAGFDDRVRPSTNVAESWHNMIKRTVKHDRHQSFETMVREFAIYLTTQSSETFNAFRRQSTRYALKPNASASFLSFGLQENRYSKSVLQEAKQGELYDPNCERKQLPFDLSKALAIDEGEGQQLTSEVRSLISYEKLITVINLPNEAERKAAVVYDPLKKNAFMVKSTGSTWTNCYCTCPVS
jgi:hypothetical protein